MRDYKDFIPGKYPEPDKRILKTDFPPVSELYRYGEDVAPPACIEEFVCKYNEKEGTPPLVLPDGLVGYCVPPKGIVTITVNGQGLRAGKAGWIYPPGTFREDKHTIGKELGTSNKELVIAREEARRDSFEAGVISVLEDKGVLELDVLRDKSPQVIEGLAAWAMKMIDDKEASRDAVNFLKLYVDKIDHKDKVLRDLREEDTFTMKEAREWLAFTKEAQGITESQVVDAKFVDEGEGENDADV